MLSQNRQCSTTPESILSSLQTGCVALASVRAFPGVKRHPSQELPAIGAPSGNRSMGLPWMLLTCCIFPKLNANFCGDHPWSVFEEKILGRLLHILLLTVQMASEKYFGWMLVSYPGLSDSLVLRWFSALIFTLLWTSSGMDNRTDSSPYI